MFIILALMCEKGALADKWHIHTRITDMCVQLLTFL